MPSNLPLNEIVSELCHDINNPLAVACGTTQQLNRLVTEDTWDAEKAKAYVERIDRSLERITKLVKGLALLARKPSENSVEQVSSEKIVELIGPFAEELLRKGKIQLNISIDPNLTFKCQTIKLSQAILSVIRHANAITKILPAKTIDLRFQKNSDSNSITVRRPKKEPEIELSQEKDLILPIEMMTELSGKLTLSTEGEFTNITFIFPN